MKYTANQPLYFPAVYMLHRFANVEHVVLMEEAQFSKFGHQSRADITTKQGITRLVLPLLNRNFRPLNEVEVDNPDLWLLKLDKTFKAVYGRHEMYKQYGHEVIEVLRGLETYTAASVGSALIKYACKVTAINCTLHSSYALIGERPPKANQWIIDIGKKLGADTYIGGATAYQNYMDTQMWIDANIDIEIQDYVMPDYPHLGDARINGNISFIDPLFLGGPELIRSLIGL